MKILLLAPQPFFQHRGTPIAVKLLAETLAGQGHQIELLTYSEGEEVEIANVRLHRIPALPWICNVKPGPSWKKLVSDALMLLQVLKLVGRLKFDLVHAVEESVFMAMLTKAIHKIPYVYDMDSSLPEQMTAKYKALRPVAALLDGCERAAVRSSSGVIAVCRFLHERAVGYDSGKPVAILEDISLLGLQDQPGEPLRETLGITGSIVMYVGNLEKYQGIDLLLEAFRQAAPKVPDARLVVVGGSEEDIRKYISRSIDIGIGDRVHFIGPKPISQLAFYLRQASVVASPRIEGQNTPMKVYSYLDSGTAVIATRLPTHTQVLDDRIAMLVSPEPSAMADGLVRLLQDEALRTDLAARAKEKVKSEFSYPAFRQKLLAFYRSMERNLNNGTHACGVECK